MAEGAPSGGGEGSCGAGTGPPPAPEGFPGRGGAAGAPPFRREAAWALLVLLLSFLPRYHYRAAGLFHVDEVITAQAVERTVGEGVLSGEVNGRYGTVLLTSLLYLPYRAVTGGSAEPVVVALGVAAGSAAVLLLYLLVLALTGRRRPALLAASFLNFHALFLVTSTTGKEHVLLLPFLLLAFLLLLEGARRRSLLLRALGSASYAAALSVHEAALPFAPALLLFLAATAGGHGAAPRRRLAGEILLLAALAAIPMAAYLGALLPTVTSAGQELSVPFVPRTLAYLRGAAGNLAEISGWPFLLLLPAGVAAAARDRLLLAFLLPWSALFLVFGVHPSNSERYLLFVMPPLAALAALGADLLATRAGSPRRGWAVTALLAGAVCGHGAYTAYPALAARSESVGPKALALAVRDATEPDALVLAMDQAPFIEYYARRKTLSHPLGGMQDALAFSNAVGTRVLLGEKVYALGSILTYDPAGAFRDYLDDAFDYLPVGGALDEGWLRGIVRPDPVWNGVFRLVIPEIPPAPGVVRRIPPLRRPTAPGPAPRARPADPSPGGTAGG